MCDSWTKFLVRCLVSMGSNPGNSESMTRVLGISRALPTGQLAAEQEGGVVGPHAVGAVVGLLHHLAALPPEVAAGHHLQ